MSLSLQSFEFSLNIIVLSLSVHKISLIGLIKSSSIFHLSIFSPKYEIDLSVILYKLSISSIDLIFEIIKCAISPLFILIIFSGSLDIFFYYNLWIKHKNTFTLNL